MEIQKFCPPIQVNDQGDPVAQGEDGDDFEDEEDDEDDEEDDEEYDEEGGFQAGGPGTPGDFDGVGALKSKDFTRSTVPLLFKRIFKCILPRLLLKACCCIPVFIR